MSKYSSTSIGYLLLGPYDIKGVSTAFEDDASQPVTDTTGFGATVKTYEQPRVAEYTLAGHDGFYDDATDSVNEAVVAMAANETVLMFAFEGNAKGKQCVCAGGAIQTDYKRSFTVGEFVKASVGLAISGVKETGKIVKALAQVSGDGNSQADYLDLGAAGAAGANVYLSCTQLTLSGRTGFTVTLMDSTDHVSWATHTAMTTLTDIGAEKKAATDLTVNRYLAAAHAFAGAGGTPTATYTLAVRVH